MTFCLENSAEKINGTQPSRKQQRNSIPDSKAASARHLLLCEVLNRKVRTEKNITLGKLKDMAFIDDPKYAEITALIIGRPFGRPSLNVPWKDVIKIDEEETIVKDPPSGQEYSEFDRADEELLLRNKILDKRILDLEGSAVEVVYDMQLLLVENKLFIVAADVSRPALLRRLGIGALAKYSLRSERVAKDEENIIPWKYVQPLGADLTETKGDLKLTVTKRRLEDIRHEDIADILEELDREERIHVFNALDVQTAASALEATEPRVQREILAETSVERVGEIFAHMSPVQIAEIIAILPFDDSQEFMKLLKGDVAHKVHQIVTEHDVSASMLAMHRFLGFPGNLTVDETFARFRKEAPDSDVTMYIYILDEVGHLKGVLDINELLHADPKSKLEEVMIRNVVTVSPTTMRPKVEELLRRYHFRAIPVVDEESCRMVGVIREKDVFLTE